MSAETNVSSVTSLSPTVTTNVGTTSILPYPTANYPPQSNTRSGIPFANTLAQSPSYTLIQSVPSLSQIAIPQVKTPVLMDEASVISSDNIPMGFTTSVLPDSITHSSVQSLSKAVTVLMSPSTHISTDKQYTTPSLKPSSATRAPISLLPVTFLELTTSTVSLTPVAPSLPRITSESSMQNTTSLKFLTSTVLTPAPSAFSQVTALEFLSSETSLLSLTASSTLDITPSTTSSTPLPSPSFQVTSSPESKHSVTSLEPLSTRVISLELKHSITSPASFSSTLLESKLSIISSASSSSPSFQLGTFSLAQSTTSLTVLSFFPSYITSVAEHVTSHELPFSIETTTPTFYSLPISSPASFRQTSSLTLHDESLVSVSTLQYVGSVSPPSQPATSLQQQMKSSSSFSVATPSSSSSQGVHTSSPFSPLASFPPDISTRVSPTKSLQGTDSTRLVEQNLPPPPSEGPSPQSSFTPTIIIGIVAIAMLMATLAGCTLVGCIVVVHCKHRPHRVASTGDRDEKDAISMKDISLSVGELDP